jgi:hypothetical protein
MPWTLFPTLSYLSGQKTLNHRSPNGELIMPVILGRASLAFRLKLLSGISFTRARVNFTSSI